MTLIKTISPEKAEGSFKKLYDQMIERTGIVPKPVEMNSASLFSFNQMAKSIEYFGNHENLNYPLLAMIRMLSAESCSNRTCADFNKSMLKKQGMTDKELENALKNPSEASLPKKDKAMLVFVIKAIKEPDSIGEKDIDTLHQNGWPDTDIFDCVSTGINMYSLNIIMRIFKI